MASPSSHVAAISFQVKRCEPELVVPAKPTPCEVKKLSEIDSQPGMRFQVPVIWFYKNSSNNNSDGRDPVKVIREALGETLVYYYPLAGRLIEDDNKNLMVDCNGRGMMFIEASADVTLQQLGPTIQPPFPYLDEVLYNVPGSDGILGCPLLLIQVTRLVCGGFILASRINHAMCDGFGIFLFMNTLGEMAQGAQHPSVPPIWQRELLGARNPQRITRIHHEYQLENIEQQPNLDEADVIQHSFTLSSNQIMEIRNVFRRISELVPDSRYYGNAFAFPAAVSKAGVLCKNPLGYAVELVKKAKLEMNAEYIRRNRSRLGYPEFGGPPMAFPLITFYVKCNNKGEDGIVVPILLPLLAMEKFQQELKKLIEGTNNKHETMQRVKITSML
ncbi:hypothetical protein FNV43_RR10343 [Rhamnella rubrinervis]|uniref:Methanol O-anthraniloyltransferase-like n=1 Tax=Rhamnella rubrinervis TaxID=2594499 RepID=A0A8K0HBN2_9ROSA|nr:hypothetical protein FNV43_RR10343 [Rhamnella rubrinervis]